jgi:hypothetical protein
MHRWDLAVISVPARQGRRVADTAHVPQSGLRPAFLLYFAMSATRRPWRDAAPVFGRRKARAFPDRAGEVLCAAK